jgi:hypothetical protein
VDSIDERLLGYLDQDDKVHDPPPPSQGERGSCTTITNNEPAASLVRKARSRGIDPTTWPTCEQRAIGVPTPHPVVLKSR